jgi:elongation factor G
MKRPKRIEKIRNIGIVAHIDAGKTTLTERILWCAGRIHRPGEVHDGNTVMDHSPIEQQRGITIASAAATLAWTVDGDEHAIHLIDTPGHVDFSVEVERSLRVLDGAVFVLDGKEGVECQTEAVWHKADARLVPRLVFVNKMDKPGADFDACVASLRERLGAPVVPVQLPLGHDGVVDLCAERALFFDGTSVVPEPIPGALRAAAAEARARLVEACADADDEVLEAWASGSPVAADALVRAVRKATLARRIVPVLAGAAYKNKGVPPLLDAVCRWLPSPLDVTEADPRDRPFAALAWKTLADRSGKTTMVRVYSGRLAAGDAVLVNPRGTKERALRLYVPFADHKEPIDEAGPGSIVAIVGLRDVRTGDTLCDPKHPVTLEPISFPDPVLEVALEAKTAKDHDALGLALARAAAADPSLAVRVDDESGQTIVGGMGTLHIEVLCQRLREEHGIELAMGRPAVALRETVLRESRVDYKHAKQTGGPGQFARVVIVVSPGERGSGVSFTDETRGGVIPAAFVPAIEKGIRASASRGVLAGHPVIDVAVRLVDGQTHPKDSSPPAFETCAAIAFREAVRAAEPALLEPIMALEIVVPRELVGDVTGDLAARRGAVREITAHGTSSVISCTAPLSRLFSYVADLRDRTNGRGTATMRMSHYALVV